MTAGQEQLRRLPLEQRADLAQEVVPRDMLMGLELHGCNDQAE